MKGRTANILQNITITLLSAILVMLLLQVFPSGQARLSALLGRAAPSPGIASQTVAETAAAPVRIICTSSYQRFGFSRITTKSPIFERAGTLLSEALGSAASRTAVSDVHFLQALRRAGLYLDLMCELPLSVVAGWVGATAEDIPVRRLLLSAAGGSVGTTLLVQDESGVCTLFSTAVPADTLLEFLSAQEGERVFFAFEDDDYSALPAITVLPESVDRMSALNASFTPSEDLTNDLLSVLDFNPHTKNRYVESVSKASVIMDTLRTVRIWPDGRIAYQGEASPDCKLLHVASAASSPLTSAVQTARTLVDTLWNTQAGAAEWYLSGVEQTANGYSIVFDYMYEGTPILLSDGSHGAKVTIEGNTITDFTLHCRTYADSGIASPLLPVAQMLAIAAHNPPCEPVVCYCDNGSERICAQWLSGTHTAGGAA